MQSSDLAAKVFVTLTKLMGKKIITSEVPPNTIPVNERQMDMQVEATIIEKDVNKIGTPSIRTQAVLGLSLIHI